MERVLEIRLPGTVTVDEMQLGFIPERETIDAVLTMRRLQEENHAEGKKLCMFCGLRESF